MPRSRGGNQRDTDEVVELAVERLGALGDGIARHKGEPIFLPFTAPGDRVRARLGASRGGGRHSALPPAANRHARRRGWLGGQKSLPCCRGDGKGRGDDEPVLVIKLSPAWKGFLSICRVVLGQV